MYILFILFAGDGAYPVSVFMLTPCRQGGLDAAQQHYNKKIGIRQAIVRAIGILMCRIRRLTELYLWILKIVAI